GLRRSGNSPDPPQVLLPLQHGQPDHDPGGPELHLCANGHREQAEIWLLPPVCWGPQLLLHPQEVSRAVLVCSSFCLTASPLLRAVYVLEAPLGENVSYLPWFEVFYKILNILADYTVKGQENQWRELLETLHSLPIPEPGVPLHLSVHTYFTVPDLRELPSIPENRNLTEYFVAVDVNNMLHLYASMLYERRIIISSSKLSTLTACVHGSAAMLYPMYWQHVYIPVLPQHLIDYCCAPMPYLIGVHSSLMEVRGPCLLDGLFCIILMPGLLSGLRRSIALSACLLSLFLLCLLAEAEGCSPGGCGHPKC
uniref:DENN/MADD domain containing 1A n=1 Tax=Paramormyrops kingsleyae TaxID=1676925 RepID=A0A3B3S3J9_9TELE